MPYLFAILVVCAFLALGSLLFIRNKDGSLKPHGLGFFLFYLAGMLVTLYLIITS
jgi:hypothetical protein